MRRVFLVPPKARLADPGLRCLAMDEHVWESGYVLVVHRMTPGPLRDFWRHYYGAGAEMAIAGDRLKGLRQDIATAEPLCAGMPEVLRFLADLGQMCAQTLSVQGSLHVIAD